MMWLQHISVEECPAQLWRMVLPAPEIPVGVVYIGLEDAVSAHPGIANVVTSFPRLAVHEVVYGDSLSDIGQKWMVRPGQESALFKNYTMHKFFNPVQMLLDRFPGILSTAKSCLWLEKRRTLVQFNHKVISLQESIPSLMEVFASQPLNDRSDLTGNEQLKDSVRIFLAAEKWGRLSISLDSWKHFLVCRLYRIFRISWCRTCVI